MRWLSRPTGGHVTEGPQERSVSVRGLEFAFLTWGPEDAEPILAIHGWMDNAATWSRIGPLVTGRRIIAPDLAGHGRSGHRTGGYSDVGHAADMIALARVLGLRRFHLLGHSAGGGIASIVAGAVPQRVGSLFCIEALGPPAIDPESAPAQLSRAVRQEPLVSARLRGPFASVEDATEPRLRGTFAMSREAADLLIAREIMQVNDRFTLRRDPTIAAEPLDRMSEEQVSAFLARIACPVRVLLARDGFTSSHALICERAAKIGADVTWAEGSHHLHLESESNAIADSISRLSGETIQPA